MRLTYAMFLLLTASVFSFTSVASAQPLTTGATMQQLAAKPTPKPKPIPICPKRCGPLDCIPLECIPL